VLAEALLQLNGDSWRVLPGVRQESEVAVYVDNLKEVGFEARQQVMAVQQIRDPQARALIPGLQIRGGADELVSYTSEQIPRPESRWLASMAPSAPL
jgi:hypothetical protein